MLLEICRNSWDWQQPGNQERLSTGSLEASGPGLLSSRRKECSRPAATQKQEHVNISRLPSRNRTCKQRAQAWAQTGGPSGRCPFWEGLHQTEALPWWYREEKTLPWSPAWTGSQNQGRDRKRVVNLVLLHSLLSTLIQFWFWFNKMGN